MHKTVILWAEQSNGCGADQFGKSSPKLHKKNKFCAIRQRLTRFSILSRALKALAKPLTIPAEYHAYYVCERSHPFTSHAFPRGGLGGKREAPPIWVIMARAAAFEERSNAKRPTRPQTSRKPGGLSL